MVSSSSSSRPQPPGFYSSQGQPPPPPPPPPPISQFGHHGYHPTQQQQQPPQMHYMTSSTTTPPRYGVIPPPPPPQPGYGHGSMYSSFPIHPQLAPASQYHASAYHSGYAQQQQQQQYQSTYSYSYGASVPVPGAAPGASPQAPRSFVHEKNNNFKMNDRKSNRKRPREKNHRQQQQQENTKVKPNTNNDVRNESDGGSSSVASTNEQQTTKKLKKDIVAKMEDKQTWTCTTCNVTVDSERAWKDHRRNHVKCTECDFEGCPKVVKGHYQAHHGKFSGSGFKTVTINIPGCKVQRFKICVGNNPEDIQKWIAERKKRFPRFSSKTNNTSQIASTESTQVTSAEEKTIDGEEKKDYQQVGEKTSHTQTGTANVLTSLLAGYGSSSSEDEVEEEKASISNSSIAKVGIDGENIFNDTKIPTGGDTEKPQQKATDSTATSPPTATTTGRKRPCRFFFGRGGSCRHGNACKFSHEVSESRQGQDVPGQQQRKKQKHEQQHKQMNKQQQRGRPTTSDTLLRKLLMPDMDRESRLSFQLLKYIHDSNFFCEDDDDDGCGTHTKTE